MDSMKRLRSRRSGFVLVGALVAMALLISGPLLTAGASNAGNSPALAEAGNLRVPTGFPASSDRFAPARKPLRYRTYVSTKGADTWDSWTSANSAKEAEFDAERMLGASGQYTHGFIEDSKTRKVIWQSW